MFAEGRRRKNPASPGNAGSSELARFERPLGGIIAVRRSLLREIRFETDYGADIGLFLDVAVDIGHIEHDSHPLEVLGDMAKQVDSLRKEER